MIEPFDVDIDLPDGKGKRHYTIHKFDAIAGREIVSQYPMSGIPKLGDYATNEGLMLKIMTYVTVATGDTTVGLTTPALVNNHVPGWETLAKLEWEVMQYNCSFFRNGTASTFFEDSMEKLPALILSTLTDLLEQSSAKSSPPSES
jgi:hypothetical protein